MRAKGLLVFIALSVFVLNGQAWPGSQWLNLPSDARDVVRKAMIDELNKQPRVFSSPQEDTTNWKFIEEEKIREDEVYREDVDKARQSFVKAKKMRDDLAAQVQSLSTDSEDALDQINTIRTTIENIDKSLIRWNQELKTHQKSFGTGLGAESQGSVLVAVTYTVDAKDAQNALDPLVDRTSVSLLAERKGTVMQSFAKALSNVLPEDFIRSLTYGAFVESGDKPLLIELAKDTRGVTYLRLKRYDFFPFQKPKTGAQIKNDSIALSAVTVNSIEDLDAFLKKANYALRSKDLNEADGLIRDTGRANIQAGERQSEQIRAFQEKNANLQKKMADSRHDRDSWASALIKQESLYESIRQDLNKIRIKMEAAEQSLKGAQSALQEKIRFQATIIPVRDAAFLKSSQTPAEAAAEAIGDKLAEVKNDARAQYSRTTREAAQVLMTDKKAEPADTDTRIVGVKLLSFIGEGDMVRIKVALRVQTTLREETPSERKEVLTDPIKAIEFVLIKGGCFQMGDPFGEGQADEKPVHAVCVDDYYIGKYEVTQEQWQSVMGNNPAFFKNCGEKCPVEQVSWNDIQEFIKKLNARTKKNYRLPTEAEWEYAARSGGKKEKYAGTSSDVELGKYAWYSANSGGSAHQAGQKQPNGLGLYDMTGNVWEWCQDWYGEKYYSLSTRKNPSGPQSGTRRVLRGGAWLFEPAGIRSATRYGLTPASRSDLYGFRLSLPLSR